MPAWKKYPVLASEEAPSSRRTLAKQRDQFRAKNGTSPDKQSSPINPKFSFSHESEVSSPPLERRSLDPLKTFLQSPENAGEGLPFLWPRPKPQREPFVKYVEVLSPEKVFASMR